LAVGIWVKVDESSFSFEVDGKDITTHISAAAYVIIVVGAIVMILGFLGCCGAIRESQCMLATFFVFLFLIFLSLLAIGIYVYVVIKPSPETLKGDIKKSFKNDVDKYEDDEEAKKRLDLARDEFHCCGAEAGDMKKKYGVEKAGRYCLAYVDSEGCAEKAYEHMKKMEEMLQKNKLIFAGVVFGIASVMLLGMIFSMLLCCAIREAM
jgi:ABC-type transport system involved in multi-copper enzyme maturation permease subunit